MEASPASQAQAGTPWTCTSTMDASKAHSRTLGPSIAPPAAVGGDQAKKSLQNDIYVLLLFTLGLANYCLNFLRLLGHLSRASSFIKEASNREGPSRAEQPVR